MNFYSIISSNTIANTTTEILLTCGATLPYVYYLLLLLVLYIVQPIIAFHIVTITRFASSTIERYNSTNCYKEGTIPSLSIESKLWRKVRFETVKNPEKVNPNPIERLTPTQPRIQEINWSEKAHAQPMPVLPILEPPIASSSPKGSRPPQCPRSTPQG